jgi:hypothetical protein
MLFNVDLSSIAKATKVFEVEAEVIDGYVDIWSVNPDYETLVAIREEISRQYWDAYWSSIEGRAEARYEEESERRSTEMREFEITGEKLDA